MKILFYSPAPVVKHLGGPKVIAELVDEMRSLGWTCDTIGPEDTGATRRFDQRARNLRDYLVENAAAYDVVDYDHGYLPYPRHLFPSGTLFVARSVLLSHHFGKIKIPEGKSLRSHVRGLVFGHRDRLASAHREDMASETVTQADLVNVTNARDKAALEAIGVDPGKIVVLPFGIGGDRRALFDAVSSDPPRVPIVAFVGSFDYRKGAADLPGIFRLISNGVSDVRFKMLGTSGMFRTSAEVLSFFPKDLQNRIDVVSRFAPEELPARLAECSVGVFPSYIEGFPFGVLEMLAASLPVIAYDSPGAPEMLPRHHLVAPGDVSGMAELVVSLLRNRSKLLGVRALARTRSQDFTWVDTARRTSEIYTAACRHRAS